jgi:hypothetical protein
MLIKIIFSKSNFNREKELVNKTYYRALNYKIREKVIKKIKMNNKKIARLICSPPKGIKMIPNNFPHFKN